MIPGQSAREDRNVILPQHQARILLGRAAGNIHQSENGVRPAPDVGALLLRHEIDGKSGDRQRLSALLCMNLLAVDMAASAQNRMAQAARQRVQYTSERKSKRLNSSH